MDSHQELSRREALRLGSAGAVGAGLWGSIAPCHAQSRADGPHKAVINIFLAGGPPHQDMWDIKLAAPAEIRGEFRPIATAVPGIQIGECFPKLAAMMDKLAIIRSVVGCSGSHDASQCLTGWDRRSLASFGGRPGIGSVLARLHGPATPGIPPTVSLAQQTRHVPWSEPTSPGFLGAGCQSFRPYGATACDRRTLAAELGKLRKTGDASGLTERMDPLSQTLLSASTSSVFANALDISQEPLAVRERYGDGKPYRFQYDGAPTCNEQLLIARRLVEAGVRSVTLSFGRWDSHANNFDLVRDHGGKLDQAVSALIQDLDDRCMLDDVTVLVWGEFGRTPHINPQAGRDHWTQVSCALMAGGGMKTGQVIGATTELGERPADRPVDMQEIVATVYHNLGIDPESTTLIDPSGRPHYLLDIRTPIAELV